jgi:hypothetical protein
MAAPAAVRFAFGPSRRDWQPGRSYDPAVARVQYVGKDDAGHRFWAARYGRCAIRIDANRPAPYRWIVSLEGCAVRKAVAPDRDEAAAEVSNASDELTHQNS